jgi:berberine-like enzyme
LNYRDVKQYLHEFDPVHDGGPVTGGTTFSKSEYFARPWPSDTIAALVDHLVHGRSPGEARELDFMPWGGAYNRVPRHATAFAHRAELFLLKYSATVPRHAPSRVQHAAKQWVREAWAIPHPSGTGGVYPNFPDPDLDDWRQAYHSTNFDRLVRCKGRYDPDDVFSFHQSIPVG